MFNIHNLREQWDLMPTALSLKVIMDELAEKDEKKLAELTQLSEPHVRRCKTLLSFPAKYHEMMLDPNSDNRVKANFFIEIHPVLDLYEALPAR
jgi:ParB family chromosome partitioning protein